MLPPTSDVPTEFFFFFVKFVLPICESLDFIFYEILDSHSIGETEERQRQSEMVNPEKKKIKKKTKTKHMFCSFS